MTLYPILKFIHVIVAIVALGANITYTVWFTRAKNNPEALAFTLHTIKVIDDYIATPAYILLLPSGWILASLAGWSLTLPWILTSLILYAAVSVIGLGIYTPTLKKQISIAERVGSNAREYKEISDRSNAISIALHIVVLIIIYLMVPKPILWG